MEDVKTLFVWMNRVQEISVIFVLAYIVAFFVWARDSSLRQLATQSLVGLGLGVARHWRRRHLRGVRVRSGVRRASTNCSSPTISGSSIPSAIT